MEGNGEGPEFHSQEHFDRSDTQGQWVEIPYVDIEKFISLRPDHQQNTPDILSVEHSIETNARDTGIFRVENKEHKQRIEQFFTDLLSNAAQLEAQVYLDQKVKGGTHRKELAQLVTALSDVLTWPSDAEEQSEKMYTYEYKNGRKQRVPRYRARFVPSVKNDKSILYVDDAKTNQTLEFEFVPRYDTEYNGKFAQRHLDGLSPTEALEQLHSQGVRSDDAIEYLSEYQEVFNNRNIDPRINISLFRNTFEEGGLENIAVLNGRPFYTDEGMFAQFSFDGFPEHTANIKLGNSNRSWNEVVGKLGSAVGGLSIDEVSRKPVAKPLAKVA